MILQGERRPETDEVQLARNVLVTSHLPLVRFLVDQAVLALPHHVDREDLQSAGVMGLMSAAERFDPSRQVQFKTFAARRIVGAILDELRAQDWAPRRIREKLKKLEHELTQLQQRLGKLPCPDEVASAMGVELEDYFGLQKEIRLISFVSLDDACRPEDGARFCLLEVLEDKRIESPQTQLIARQTVERLAELIASLPNKERIVITLYYYEDLNLKQIGATLNLKESRISQLHRKAIARLGKLSESTGLNCQ